MVKCKLNVKRAEKNISQKELSETLGIRMQTISDMEQGKSKALSVDTIDKLCTFFNCSISDIWEFQSNSQSNNNQS